MGKWGLSAFPIYEYYVRYTLQIEEGVMGLSRILWFPMSLQCCDQKFGVIDKRVQIFEEWDPNRCYLLFYYAYERLNMFRALLCSSSGARDYRADYYIGRPVLGLLLVGS